MEEKDDQVIAREPWQRLLQSESEAPPETTDARIRAAARHPLVKRPARWWLPASLAASFVLAFLLVQSQLGERPAPAAVTESDVREPEPAAAQDGPATAAEADAYTLPERRDQRAPAGETLDRVLPRPKTQDPVVPRAESPPSGLWAGPRSQPARVPDVERSAERESTAAETRADANAASSRDPSEVAVTGSRVRESKLETTTPTAQATAAMVAADRSPEAWYAAIESLRADGRTEEAERELKQLKEAYPGWLERHLAEQQRKEAQEQQ